MKIGGRHERDYFNAAIEVAPPALQAIAAVAVTFALTFAGHHFVPDWSVALTLAVGLITLVAASIWSWRARRLLLAYPRKDQRDARTRPLSANSRWWLTAAIASALLLLALCPFLYITGKMPNPSFASPYDGIDPGTSPCVQSAQPLSDQGRPTLRDPEGRPVGYVQLVRSVACATVWARVILQPPFAKQLKGDIALITMVRPGDNATAAYPLLLRGGTIGFGNMLSDAESCVISQVSITASNGKPTGPETQTACR
jgi:hypothetical protein